MISERTDVFSAEFKANPFPFFACLRAEQPVYRTALPDKNSVWLVTRNKDVNFLLKSELFVKDRYNAMTPEQISRQPEAHPMFRPLERSILDLDAPEHTRLRALVHKAFTPRLVEKMRARAQTLADELLDAVAAKGEMDVIADYALPLPMLLITEILGVPAQDRDKFREWSKIIVSVYPFNNDWRVFPVIERFNHYLRGFLKLRRAEPKDDLVSALIQAEETGDKLSEDELLAMIFMLLIAGHETTVNLIGNGILTLLEFPEQMEKLRRDSSLVKSAVEEFLRYTSPVFMVPRYARENVIVGETKIERGEMMLCVLGSANRDEAVFSNPDTPDITRRNNRHLAFGQGVHFCLGAHLARMEAQIAVGTLLRRMPDLRLKNAPQSLSWSRSLLMRGLESLAVEF